MFCTNCGIEVNEEGLFCSSCGSKININYKQQPPGTNNEKELILYYFSKGYKYQMFIRTLKRRLQSFGLQKTAYNLTGESLIQIISGEIEGLASTKGYRALWSSLKMSYGINTQRDVVMKMLRDMDPGETETSRARRLRRRQYVSVGPNLCWHADGYDKRKPYGFPIHGFVDAFLRKLLWIKVFRTKTDPVVSAYLYIETVEKIEFCPQYNRECNTSSKKIGFCRQCNRECNTSRYPVSTVQQRM